MSKKDLYDVFDNADAKDLDMLGCHNVGTDTIDSAALCRIKNHAVSKIKARAVKKKKAQFSVNRAFLAVASCLVICIGIGIAFSITPIMNFINSSDIPIGSGAITARPVTQVTDALMQNSKDSVTTSSPESGTIPPETEITPAIAPSLADVKAYKGSMQLYDISWEPGITDSEEVASENKMLAGSIIKQQIYYIKELNAYGVRFKLVFTKGYSGSFRLTIDGNVTIYVKEDGEENYTDCGKSVELMIDGSGLSVNAPMIFVACDEKNFSYTIKLTVHEKNGLVKEAVFATAETGRPFGVDSGTQTQEEWCELSVIRAATFREVEGRTEYASQEYLDCFFTPVTNDNVIGAPEIFRADILDLINLYLKEDMYLYEVVALLGKATSGDLKQKSISYSFYNNTVSGVVEIDLIRENTNSDYIVRNINVLYDE